MSEKKFFTYKNKPLVRCDNTIYYGDMNDGFVSKLEIKSTKKVKDLDVSTEIAVEILATDLQVSSGSQKYLKSGKKNSLFAALDIADAWLNSAIDAAV